MTTHLFGKDIFLVLQQDCQYIDVYKRQDINKLRIESLALQEEKKNLLKKNG